MNMKLAKIEHRRCDEWAGTTYVWVDDTMTQSEIVHLIDRARETYLKVEADFAESPDAPKNPGYSPAYDKHPDKTVADVKAMFDADRKAFREWDAKRTEARQPFSYHLAKISNGLVKEFYNHSPELQAEIRWGHRHGQKIVYGTTKPYNQDFGFIASEDDAEDVD